MFDHARSPRPPSSAPSGPAPGHAGGARVPGPFTGRGPAALGGSNRERVRALGEGGSAQPPELLALAGQDLVGNEQLLEWCGLGRRSRAAAGAGRAEGAPGPGAPGVARSRSAPAEGAPGHGAPGAPTSRSAPAAPPPPPPAPEAAAAPRRAASTPAAAPASAPASAPSAAAVLAALPTVAPADPVVDHYMNANWDRHRYDEACASFNVRPEGVGTLVEQSLPPTLGTEAIQAANVTSALVFSGADSLTTLVAGLVPGVGLAYGLFTEARASMDGANRVPPQLAGEALGPALIGYEALRSTVASAGKVSGYLADNLSLLQSALSVVSAAQAGAGALPTAGAGAVMVGGLSITGSGLRGVAAGCDGVNALLDTAATGVAMWRAGEAERAGDLEAAGALRAWSQTHAIRALGSWIGAVMSAASMALQNFAPAEAASGGVQTLLDFGDAALKVGKKANTATWTPMGKATAAPGADADLTAQLAAYGLADLVRVQDPPYPPAGAAPGAGEASALVRASRARSAASLDRGWADLHAEDPAWTPGLLAAVRNPKELGPIDLLLKATAPSGILELIFFGLGEPERGIAGLFLGAGGQAATAGVLGLVAPALEAVTTLDERLLEALPTVDDFVATREVALDTWRNAARQLSARRGQLDALEESAGRLGHALGDTRAEILGLLLRLDALLDELGPPTPLGGPALLAVGVLEDELLELLVGLDAELREGSDTVLTAVSEGRGALDAVLAEGGAGEQAIHLAIDQALGLREGVELLLVRWRDADLHIDVRAFLAWATEARRRMAELPRQLQVPEFMRHLDLVADPYIAAWRARHGAQVLEAFFPSVPPRELDAAREAYDRRRAELGAPPWLEAAWRQAQAAAGGQGLDAVEAFREAVDHLLTVEAPADAAPPDAAPAATTPDEGDAYSPPGTQPRG